MLFFVKKTFAKMELKTENRIFSELFQFVEIIQTCTKVPTNNL